MAKAKNQVEVVETKVEGDELVETVVETETVEVKLTPKTPASSKPCAHCGKNERMTLVSRTTGKERKYTYCKECEGGRQKFNRETKKIKATPLTEIGINNAVVGRLAQMEIETVGQYLALNDTPAGVGSKSDQAITDWFDKMTEDLNW